MRGEGFRDRLEIEAADPDCQRRPPDHGASGLPRDRLLEAACAGLGPYALASGTGTLDGIALVPELYFAFMNRNANSERVLESGN